MDAEFFLYPAVKQQVLILYYVQFLFILKNEYKINISPIVSLSHFPFHLLKGVMEVKLGFLPPLNGLMDAELYTHIIQYIESCVRMSLYRTQVDLV